MAGANATPDKTRRTNATEVGSYGDTRVNSLANTNYQRRYNQCNTCAEEGANSEPKRKRERLTTRLEQAQNYKHHAHDKCEEGGSNGSGEQWAHVF